MTPLPIPRGPGKARIWLTADEHYFHENIIKYQGRPFANVREMNEALIDNHNAVVKEGDFVFHVGDICLGSLFDLVSVLRRLNGTHYLIDGSHDRAMSQYEREPAADLSGKVVLLPKLVEFKYGGEKITLCHYAMAKWWCSHHGAPHFFGHSHGHYDPPGRAIDVGVDVQGFAPILIDEAIRKALKKQVIANHPRDEGDGE